jgi:hypothetical protein
MKQHRNIYECIKCIKARVNSVSIVTVCGFDNRGSIPDKGTNFSLRPRVRTGSGAYAASIKWVPRCFFPGVKRPGCDVDHLPTTSAEVKNA